MVSPQVATRLLGHKIQSPQEKEALQALTVSLHNALNNILWPSQCQMLSSFPFHHSNYSFLYTFKKKDILLLVLQAVDAVDAVYEVRE